MKVFTFAQGAVRYRDRYMSETKELQPVFSKFAIDGECIEIEELKRGHIHDTFVSTWATQHGRKRFVHQRMNSHVFKDIDL